MLFNPHLSPLQSKLSKPTVLNKSFLFSPLPFPYHFSPLQSTLPKPDGLNMSYLFNPLCFHVASLLSDSLPLISLHFSSVQASETICLKHIIPLQPAALSYRFFPLKSKLPKQNVINKSFLFRLTSLHIHYFLFSPSFRNHMFLINLFLFGPVLFHITFFPLQSKLPKQDV